MTNKKFLFICSSIFSVCLSAFSIATAKSIEVSSKPSQVTVFPQGARVLRTASMQLPAGEHTVIFNDIPAGAAEDSLRLSAKGPQGTKIFNVRFSKKNEFKTIQKGARQLEEKIQRSVDDVEDLEDGIQARLAEKEILQSLSQSNAGKAANTGAIRDFTQSVKAAGQRLSELARFNRTDRRKQRDLKQRIKKLKKDLKELGQKEKQRRVAMADLELRKAGKVDFELVYQLRSARWTPLYDLRLQASEESPKIAMTFLASIQQNSAENWENVSLTLSTARLRRGTRVPDPTRWWLDFLSIPKPRRYKALSKKRAFAAGAVSDFALAPVSAALENERIQTLSTAFAVTYKIKLKKDIPAGNQKHRVTISQATYPVHLNRVIVPRLAQAAFIEAEIQYTGRQQLLPGKASLFRGGNYVGSAPLKAIAPQEAFKLGFGQDDKIKVTRKLIGKKDNPGTGFLKSKGKRRYHWETSLRNFHSSIQKVELREQLPRSRQDQISVKELKLNPKPQKEDKSKPGLKIWKLKLAPQEKTVVTFSYQIKWPDDRIITGME